MMKLFVFSCLLCCALGFPQIVSNGLMDCKVHVKYETSSPEESFEYFGVFNFYEGSFFTSYPRLAKIVTGSGQVGYLRCDERDENNNCYVKEFNLNDPVDTCKEYYDEPYDYTLPNFPYSFEYEGNYPVATDCPDKTSTGCELYCNGHEEPECVIVDAKGRFVKDKYGNVWTYLEPPTMDVFEVDKCDPDATHSHLSAPGDLCEAAAVFEPAELGCSFHIKQEDSYTNMEEFFGISVDDKPFMVKDVRTDTDTLVGTTTLVRCDDRQDDYCYTKTTDDQGSCTESYDSQISISNYWPRFYDFEYDSLDYPQPADCPDNGQGCQKYCTDYMEDKCITVDAAGHIVLDENGAKWTYFGAPSMEVFKDTKCDDPTAEIPTPPDYCSGGELAKIYPSIPECKFHLQRVTNQIPTDVYSVSVNGSLAMLSVDVGFASLLIRCDIQDNDGNCFEKFSTSLFTTLCQDGFDVDAPLSVETFFPKPFSYNRTLYPLDDECPDHSACKKYCDVFGECTLVDTNGYFVKVGDDVITYSSDFSMDVFDAVGCDGTPLPTAPTADPCSATGSQSSSGEAPSTPSTPGASSSLGASSSPAKPSVNPSVSALSSASIVDVAFTFVAFATAMALLL